MEMLNISEWFGNKYFVKIIMAEITVIKVRVWIARKFSKLMRRRSNNGNIYCPFKAFFCYLFAKNSVM